MLVHHTFSILLFVTLAYGGPLVGRNPQCNTGTMQCCQITKSASAPLIQELAKELVELSNLGSETQVGLQCTSLAGAGSGTGCQATAVCCDNTTSNNFIYMGCNPISL